VQKIVPFLWFDTQAEEAAQLYTSLFDNSKILARAYYGETGPGPAGSLMTISFQLEGQTFTALNGGPVFTFTPATSLFVTCRTEQEVDALWRTLSENGKVLMPLQKYPFSEKFGWVADRYGLSWQLHLMRTEKKITPFLMFVGDQNGKAEEAIRYYASVLPDSGIGQVMKYGPGQGGQEGTVMHARFSLAGRAFMAMDSDGDHRFTFTPALSFYINCDTQEEIDTLWETMSRGGKKVECGWVQDRYGVSWQIVPSIIAELESGPDRARANRVMEAILKMKKLDIRTIEKAARG